MQNLENLKNQFIGFLRLHSIYKNSLIPKYPIFNLGSEIDLRNENQLIDVPEKLMLGKRVERFFEIAINQGSKYNVVVKNIQIQDNKITLGEFDFILKDIETNQLIHVELVCKYYLLDESVDECWIGPNRKDGLHQKLNKLEEKQFPLLKTKEAEDQLAEFGVNTNNIDQCLCFKASLFVPIKLYQSKYNFNINHDCILGYWIKKNEFFDGSFDNEKFYIPLKQDWLIDPCRNVSWEEFDQVKTKIITSLDFKLSPLVWKKDENGICERFFIVWW